MLVPECLRAARSSAALKKDVVSAETRPISSERSFNLSAEDNFGVAFDELLFVSPGLAI